MRIGSLASRAYTGSRSFNLSGAQQSDQKKALTLRELQEAKEAKSTTSDSVAAQEGKRFVGGFRREDGNTIVEISGQALSKLKNAQNAAQSDAKQGTNTTGGTSAQTTASGAQTATGRRGVGTPASNSTVGAQAGTRSAVDRTANDGAGALAAGRRRIGMQTTAKNRVSADSATDKQSVGAFAANENTESRATATGRRRIGTQAVGSELASATSTIGERRIGTQSGANQRGLGTRTMSANRRGTQMQSVTAKKQAVDIRSLGKQSVALQNQRNAAPSRTGLNRRTPLMRLQTEGA